jgi:hypothetical protein
MDSLSYAALSAALVTGFDVSLRNHPPHPARQVMKKKDHCLRAEEMRRKTLGVLRKMYLTTSALAGAVSSTQDKIELKIGDFSDSNQFQVG